MLRSLNDLARQLGGQITKQECCGDFAIGINGNKHFTDFYKLRKWEAIARMRTCRISNPAEL